MIAQDWEGKQLDKDILVIGNKEYSPEFCCFVSSAINSLLNDCGARRGLHPQGVCWDKAVSMFMASIHINGKNKNLGNFPTANEAETAYKQAKKALIIEIAQTQKQNIKEGLLRHAELLTMDDSKNKLTVLRRNSIIEAGYRLSVYENRILLICISRLDNIGTIGLDDVFTVSAQDLVELSGLDSKSIYRSLKQAVDRLRERSVTVELPNDEVLKMRWVSSIKYITQAGMIEFQFSKNIIPYISQLRREFTRYRLNDVLRFKSSHSIRIYELLINRGGNERIIEVDWLKKQFQIEDKYKTIGDLKSNVLNIAMTEINQHSDMTASYSQIKRGRKVVAFRFTYEIKSKTIRHTGLLS